MKFPAPVSLQWIAQLIGAELLGNTTVEVKNTSILSIIIMILLILIITGAVAYFGYNYYNKKINGVPSATPVISQKVQDISLLPSISTLFPDNLGRFIDNAKKNSFGYTLTITSVNSYSSVFSYMIKNENAYAEDIATALGVPRDTSTTTPPFVFSDITLNNQNMRIGKSGSRTIIYAFINTEALVFATTPEGILSLRGDIIR